MIKKMKKNKLIVLMLFIIFMRSSAVYAESINIKIGLLFGENAPIEVSLKASKGFCIGSFKKDDGFEAFKETDYKQLKVVLEKDYVNFIAPQEGEILKVKAGNTVAVEIRPKDDKIIYINQKPYRGKAIIRPSDTGLTVINELDLEEYLYGVLPMEMPYNWPLEALKAQAIAARTYALKNFNKYQEYGFNLSNSIDSQVYGGYGVERELTNKAVDATAGQIIVYNNELINAFYHADNGGFAESSNNVWEFSLPYLKSGPDKFSINTPHSSWEKTLSIKDIEQMLIQKNIIIDRVIGLKILDTSESGRVTRLMIVGSKNSIILTKQSIRDVLDLKSNLFRIETDNMFYILNGHGNTVTRDYFQSLAFVTNKGMYKNNNMEIIQIKGYNGTRKFSNRSRNYVIKGRGWGHGVGLSQWGAKRMAEMGYDCTEILQHYYRGSHIKKMGVNVINELERILLSSTERVNSSGSFRKKR